jgi:hypothetical protein
MNHVLGEAARVLVVDVAGLKEKSNVLLISGLHNKTFADLVALESYRVGACPHIWVFDENFFVRHSRQVSSDAVAVLPKNLRALIEESDVIVWLSQYDKIESVPMDVRKGVFSFWMLFMRL